MIAFVGIVLKLFRVTGGGLTFTASLVILSILYYFFCFAMLHDIRFRNILKRESYANTNPKRIIGAIVAGFTFSSIVLGILFKIQAWEGASELLLYGLIPLIILSVIAYFRSRKNKIEFYKNIFFRAVIYGSLGLILYLVPEWFIRLIFYS